MTYVLLLLLAALPAGSYRTRLNTESLEEVVSTTFVEDPSDLLNEDDHEIAGAKIKWGTSGCTFKVWRKRIAKKVISTSLFKRSVGYLDNFEKAISAWPSMIKETYGNDWNLRLYVDQSAFRTLREEKDVEQERAVHANLGKDRSEVKKFTLKDAGKGDQGVLKDQIMRVSNRDDSWNNVELWKFQCSTNMIGQKSVDDTWDVEKLSNADEKDFYLFFGTIMRFHPFFDSNVDVTVSRNFEFLTSQHDVQVIKDWLAESPPKKFLVDVRDYKYTGTYGECVPGSNEKFHALDAIAPKTKRHMIMAGLFAVQKLSGEQAGLPFIVWDLIKEVAKACGFNEKKYGYDEIGLTYALKYVPRLVQAGVASAQNGNAQEAAQAVIEGMFGPFWTFDRSKDYLNLPRVDTNTIHARPLYKDLRKMFKGQIRLEANALTLAEVTALEASLLSNFESFTSLCDVTCDRDFGLLFHTQVADICAKSDFVLPAVREDVFSLDDGEVASKFWRILEGLDDLHLCFPAENLVRDFLLGATKPNSEEDEQVVRRFLNGLSTVFAEFFSEDEYPEYMPGDLLDNVVPDHADHPRLWLYAALQHSVLTAADYPGFQTKSKTGEIFEQAVKQIALGHTLTEKYRQSVDHLFK